MILGRMDEVDRTIKNAESAANELNKRGLRSKHAEILIEDAVKECNIIIAPDGILREPDI